jgi:hypothetical protein
MVTQTETEISKLVSADLSDADIELIIKKSNPDIESRELECQVLTYRIIRLKEHEQLLNKQLKQRDFSKTDTVEQLRLINKQLSQIKHEIHTHESSLKNLTMPIQQQLPEIFENRRLIPNSFLRGALFGIVKKGKRAIVKDTKIFSMSHYDISFSGEYLDQNDLELWDSLIYLAKNKHIDYELRITLYELRKFIGYSQTKSAYDAIITRAKRLKFAMVEIKKDKVAYFGSLIDDVLIDQEEDGKLVIRFNKKLVSLFSDKDYTIISQDIRKQIGDNQLARWLYNFYESHKEPIPFKIELIKNLCRSEANIYKFRSMLKEALLIVKKGYIAVGRVFEYEIKDDTLYITKSASKVQVQAKRF